MSTATGQAEAQTTTPAGNADLRMRLSVCAFICILTFVSFIQVRHFDFINLDDGGYVLENQHVLAGLTAGGIKWAFTTFFIANWHPLTWLSHMADVSLFGVDPGCHHVVNCVLHTLNAGLVFWILSFLTRSTWKSALAAALFAVHPLRMESVAWISERKDLLCALFFLLAIGAYGLYARGGGKRWYAATATAFALGILAKPMIVTLPCVLLLLDCWPLKRAESIGRLIAEKLPLFAMSLASAIVTTIAQQGAMVATQRLPLMSRLGNAIWAYGRYLKKTALPDDLAAFYPLWSGRGKVNLPWGDVAISAAVLIVITMLAIVLYRRQRAAMIGWLWFLGMLVPTIGLVQVGSQSLADRYTYLPHIGLFVAIVWPVGKVVEQRPAFARLALAVGCVAVGLFAGSTMYQLRYWENSYTLFDHALRVTEHNSTAAACVGEYLSKHQRNQEAKPYYELALQYDPNNAAAYLNLANVLAEEGKTEKALEYARDAAQLDPRKASAQNNLANVLMLLGQTDEAIVHHKRAIELDPDLPQAHYNYGATLAQLGRMGEAKEQLTQALRLRPDYPNARYAYGLALMMDHNIPAATEQFEIALRQLSNSGHDRALKAQIEARLHMLRSSPPTTSPSQ